MEQWQPSSVWPLSCYGIGGKGCLNGLDDISIEEFRYYFMQNNNSVPAEIQQRFNIQQQVRMSYQSMGPEQREAVVCTETKLFNFL